MRHWHLFNYSDPSIQGGLQAGIDEALKWNGIPIIAHPVFSNLTAEKILNGSNNCKHIEIANMCTARELSPDEEAEIAKCESIWDRVLSAGKLMYGIACDDAHSLKATGLGWIMVKADTLSKKAILGGIENGDFYSSTGIILRDYKVDKLTKTISVESVNADTIKFIVKNGSVIKSVIGKEASYKVQGNEYYIRARLTNSSREKGWTQPVYVSEF